MPQGYDPGHPETPAKPKKKPDTLSPREDLLHQEAVATSELYSRIDSSVLANSNLNPSAGYAVTNTPENPAINLPFAPPSGGREVAVYNAGLAGRLDISSARTNDMFAGAAYGAIKQAPHTLAYYAASNQDEQTFQGINDTIVWYSKVYGNDAMGVFAMTHLIGDPVSAQRTRDVLGDIAGLTPGTAPYVYGYHTGGTGLAGSYENTANAAPNASDQANLDTLLANPGDLQNTFNRFTPAEQRGVTTLAQELQASFAQTAPSKQIDQFMRTVAVAKDGYSVALSPEDTNTIDQLVKLASTGIGGTTQDVNELGVKVVNGVPTAQGDLGKLNLAAQQLGIEQFRRKQGGVLVLDEAWAKANPSDALAIQEYLQAQYPTASIQIGKQGIIGSLIDKVGMPIDYISAPFGAALHYGDERLQQLTADGDPQKTLQLVADAQVSIADGLTPKWVRDAFSAGGTMFGDVNNPEDVQRFLAHIKDQNTFDTSASSIWTDLKDNTRPEQMGFGIGDTFTKAAGLLPGDQGYEVARLGISMIANIALDPLTWAPPIVGGVRAASRIPLLPEVVDTGLVDAKGAAILRETGGTIIPKITNSWIKQYTYMKFAKVPEDFVLTPTFIGTANSLWDIRQAAGSADAFATALVANGSYDLERARQLAMATSREDMAIALMADTLGINQTKVLSDTFDVMQKRNALELRLGTPGLSPVERADLEAQRSFYDSVIQGSDLVKPYDAMPSYRQIRRLQNAVRTEPTGIEKAIVAAEDTVKRFPSSLFPRTSASLKKFETAQADVTAARAAVAEAEAGGIASEIRTAERALARAEADVAYQNRKSIVRMYGEFRNLWRPAGFGGRFVFEDSSAYSTFTGIRQAREELAAATRVGDQAAIKAAENALASAETSMVGAVNQGLTDLRDAARMMNIPDKRFRQLIEPLVAGTMKDDVPAQYKWFKDTWATLVDESPKLSLIAKKDLRKLFDVAVADRTGSVMTEISPATGEAKAVGVLTRHIPGQEAAYVIPSLSADMVRSIPLPSLEHFRELATNTGRTMTYWNTLGRDPRRAISVLHGWLARGWQQGVSVWRCWVLGSRLFFGLPARIIGEQQLRMAAFEYNSSVWHPLEWFRSTNWNASFFDKPEDLWLAAGSPEHALGAMVDNIAPQWGSVGRNFVSLDDGSPFFRSYSSELQRYFRSPEVREWRLVGGEIQSPADYLRLMRETPVKGEAWMRHLESTVKPGQTVPEAVGQAAVNMHRDMTQLIGTGEGADYVKTALSLGYVDVAGTRYFVGTDEFANMLERLAKEGRWTPGKITLTRDAGTLLGGDVPHLAAGMRDRLFSMFYSRPDLATSRVPLYHQIWEREYSNLIKFGYSPERAIEVARSTAASGTADIMFQIGAHTSGEYFMRSIMPFFPAYRELGTTWLYRIPARIGQMQESAFALLGWGLGATALTRRASIVINTMKEAGFIHEDAQGHMYVNIPFLGPLLNFATGTHTQWDTRIPVESAVGILPVPFGFSQVDETGNALPWYQRLRGMLPTLGGPSVLVLASLKDKFPNIIGPLEDWTTMFGSDTSIGPHSLDMIWQMTHNGEAPPWVLGRTKTLQEAAYSWATIDGIRLAMNEIPAPVWHEGMSLEEQKKFATAQNAWLDQVTAKGQRYATGMYFLKSVIGGALPFSISMTDEVKSEYSQVWQLLNRLPGGAGGQLTSSLYPSILAANPEMGPYSVSKSIDKRYIDNPDRSLQAYMDAVAAKEIVPRDPREWALFAWGMNSRTLHYAQLARIRDESGATFGERLMNHDATDALIAENQSWKDFLTYSEQETTRLGYSQSLSDMFRAYDQFRAKQRGEPGPLITASQQGLIDFDTSMKTYSQYFDYNYATAGSYTKAKTQAYNALFAGKTQTPEQQARSWYFNKVLDPYFKKRDDLYASLATAQDQALVYTDIRKLEDRYNIKWTNSDHPGWGTFPSPEAYSFSLKTQEEQNADKAKWATYPGDWLTAFQREQAGYDIPPKQQDKVTKYVNYYALLDHSLTAYEDKYNISGSSNQHEADVALRDKYAAEYADKLGVTDVVKQMNAPAYRRVGNALDLSNTTRNWDKVTQDIGWAMDYLKSANIDPQGDDAEKTRELFAKRVNRFRAADPKLDNALTQIAAAVGRTNVYDFYDYLFFDKF